MQTPSRYPTPGSKRSLRLFLLTGKDGGLNYPVYEGAGNHDGGISTSTRGGDVRRRIIERNPKRPSVTNISGNGLHYSWDWDDVHFVMLNEYAGLENGERYPGNPAYLRKMQSYGNPAEESLRFLRKDLKEKVGESDRPVLIKRRHNHQRRGCFQRGKRQPPVT